MPVMVVLSARPEANKLAPLVLTARHRDDMDVLLCNTGQHREMSAQVLELFGFEPNTVAYI
jgi:UDP-N-acetylglucosamine 2-epimerase (non-hydrolysing)